MSVRPSWLVLLGMVQPLIEQTSHVRLKDDHGNIKLSKQMFARTHSANRRLTSYRVCFTVYVPPPRPYFACPAIYELVCAQQAHCVLKPTLYIQNLIEDCQLTRDSANHKLRTLVWLPLSSMPAVNIGLIDPRVQKLVGPGTYPLQGRDIPGYNEYCLTPVFPLVGAICEATPLMPELHGIRPTERALECLPPSREVKADISEYFGAALSR